MFKTTAWHNSLHFGLTNKRALPNLSRVAGAFVEAKAHWAGAAINVNQIALSSGLDRAHVQRLLSDRPGFTKTISVLNGKQHTGWYYHREFLREAEDQNPELFYPISTLPLANKTWPAVEVLNLAASAPTNGDIVHYSGSSPKQDPVAIDTIELDDARLAKLLDARYQLFDQTREQYEKNLQALRLGKAVDLSGIEQSLVLLASYYSWLKSAIGRPEIALQIHEIVGDKD